MIKESKRLIKLVSREIEDLKQHATKKELSKLNFGNLYPLSGNDCIYGQMTGHCRSNRAIELIKKCTKKYVKGTGSELNLVNKAENEVSVCDFHWSNTDNKNYMSTLEHFIIWHNHHNGDILDYLKGKTDKLELTIKENN